MIVENGMVAHLRMACCQVQVSDVSGRWMIAKEESSEIVFIQLGAAIPCLLHANPGAKEFKVPEV